MFNFVKTFPEKCKTVGGDDVNKTCIFPFKVDGVEYATCFENWCSTFVDELGVHTRGIGKWGDCGPNCPMPRTKC